MHTYRLLFMSGHVMGWALSRLGFMHTYRFRLVTL